MVETFPSDTDPYKKYGNVPVEVLTETENGDIVGVFETQETLEDILEEACPEALTADGFNDAIIGYCYDMVAGCNRVVYDYEKMVDILVKRDEMTQEEAVEFIDFNVVGAFMGKNTPIYMNKIEC